MEYDEAISREAREGALPIALRRLAQGAADFRRVAAEAVAEAPCNSPARARPKSRFWRSTPS